MRTDGGCIATLVVGYHKTVPLGIEEPYRNSTDVNASRDARRREHPSHHAR